MKGRLMLTNRGNMFHPAVRGFRLFLTFGIMAIVGLLYFLNWKTSRMLVDTGELIGHKQCIAVGILSAPGELSRRNEVRDTWKLIAHANDVKVYFVIGSQGLDPEEEKQILEENEQHFDVRLFDVPEGYGNLFMKTISWFSWASQSLDCRYVFKTDSDSYVRVPQLLDFVKRRVSTRDGLVYFGHQFGGKRSPVNVDPQSPWYMRDQYDHKYFPKYMSGSGYGMSTDLAKRLSRFARESPKYRCEDAGVGIIMDRLRRRVSFEFVTGPEFDFSRCDQRTILDNPAFSANSYTIRNRFEADLEGRFCEASERNGLTSPGKHVD